jgi:hypothetical protein
MAQLSINGVPLPVLIESMGIDQEPVGSVARNARGWRVMDRRAIKRTLTFSLGPKPLDEAMMYRALIQGEGEHWTANSSVYGDKGLPLTGTGAIVAGACVDPYGVAGGFQMANAGTMILPAVGPDQSAVARGINAGGTKVAGRLGQTLIGWRGVGTTGTNACSAWRAFGWSWRAFETPTVKREQLGALGASGAVGAYTGGETFGSSAGILTTTMAGLAGGTAATLFSMWLLPWYFPQAQVDTLLAGLVSLLSPQPQLPGLFVQTDLLPDTQLDNVTAAGESTLVCHGEVKSMAVKGLSVGGAYSKTQLGMAGSLVEV